MDFQLQHHGGHERLHRLGHGGRQLRSQDGGEPALPGHSGEDHATDTKVANALLGAVTAAALAWQGGRKRAGLPTLRLGHAAGGRHQDSKYPAGSCREAFVAAQLAALTGSLASRLTLLDLEFCHLTPARGRLTGHELRAARGRRRCLPRTCSLAEASYYTITQVFVGQRCR